MTESDIDHLLKTAPVETPAQRAHEAWSLANGLAEKYPQGSFERALWTICAAIAHYGEHPIEKPGKYYGAATAHRIVQAWRRKL